jgi:NTE family protein
MPAFRLPRPASALLAAWLAASALVPVPATAQAPPAPAEAKRPKICLVLSGGGARGAAHIGVLKVLDEMRVPIHCVAGTSMGSIVGGAFATGITVPEMEKIIGTMSTDLLFKEKPPRQERSIRRKQDDYTILFTPDIGLRDGEILLPQGLVSGVQLETVLRRLARIEGFRKFDDLPIPFRAVATDLVTGKPVVFSEGEVVRAMRASMSVPGAVAPVEIDGRLLVDGGLVDNLPVDVARTMGADVVIAVNLGTPLMKRDQLGSIFGVVGQMIGILTEQNVQASLASLKPTDILILPELGDYSAANFDHMPQTIPIGEAAARKVADRLAQFSLPPAEYAALRKRQLAVVVPDLRPADEIVFPGLRRVNPAVLAAEMETKPRQPIDQATLDRDMLRLYGTDDFEHVNYRFVETPSGSRVLAVEAIERSWGPNYVRFGLGLSSDFRGDAYWNVLGTYRMTWLNSLGGEWRSAVQLGTTSLLYTEFYQPLDVRRYFFVAPYAGVERQLFNLYQGDDRIARYDISYGRVGFDLGSQFTRYGELRLGLYYGKVNPSLDTGPQFLDPGPEVTQAGGRARLFLDQLDNVNFPRSGYGGSLDVLNSREALGADANYTRWSANGMLAHSFGPHTFNLGYNFGGSIGSNPLPAYDLFAWGGFLQQSGLPTGALYGRRLAFGRLVYYNRLLHLPYLEGVYAGGSLEVGKVGGSLVPGSQYGTLTSVSAFLGLDSLIGPIYLAGGLASNGTSSFYFFLGRPWGIAGTGGQP